VVDERHEDVFVVYAGKAENHLEVVPLRLAPSWQRNFNEFVTGVEIKKTRALENGAYAFEFLTAEAMQAEDGLTAPSFDVAFIHNQSIDGIVERLTELVPQIGGELKLALELTESAGQLSLNLAYRAGSMQSEIIAQLETWLNSLVSNVARDVGKRIGDIALENDNAVVTVPDDLYGTQFSF